ncbi:hypothetical protein [Nonomuraea sp. NPDC002799]
MANDNKTDVPELYLADVDEDTFAQLEGTTISYAPIEAGDAYALRDAANPDAGELRLPGDALRKLSRIV